MDSVLDQPSVVLVSFAVASFLLLVEIALPTFGVAGAAAFGLGILGVVAIDRQDATWWPLLGVAVAVSLWGVLIARRSHSAAGAGAAAALFAAGSIGFGLAAQDALTVVVAIVATAGVTAGFPPLLRASDRLLGEAPLVGLESFVGQTAEVVRWDGDRGTVRIEGSLWNATGAQPLVPGAGAVVVGHDGMTVVVSPAPVHH